MKPLFSSYAHRDDRLKEFLKCLNGISKKENVNKTQRRNVDTKVQHQT